MPIPVLVYGALYYGGIYGTFGALGYQVAKSVGDIGEDEDDEAGFRLSPELRKVQGCVRRHFSEAWAGEAHRQWSARVAPPYSRLDAVAVSRYGIPAAQRVAAWLELSGAVRRMREAARPYSALPEAGGRQQRTIAGDIHRTFPRCRLFEEAGGPGQRALSRLLGRLADRTPDGYCQSMNFIAAFLLLVCAPPPSEAKGERGTAGCPGGAGAEEAAAQELPGEEDAFWILDAVVHEERYNRDYYTDSTAGEPGSGLKQCVADLGVLDILVEHRLPRLARHLAELEISAGALCNKWLLCIFVDSTPWQYSLVIFDLYLMRGTPFLISLCLLTLAKFEQQLLQCALDTIQATARDSLRHDSKLTPVLQAALCGDWSIRDHDHLARLRLESDQAARLRELRDDEDREWGALSRAARRSARSPH